MLIVAGGRPAQPLQESNRGPQTLQGACPPTLRRPDAPNDLCGVALRLRFTGAPECRGRATVDGVRATLRPPLGDEGTCEPQVGTWLMSSALRYARCTWQPSGAKGPWVEEYVMWVEEYVMRKGERRTAAIAAIAAHLPAGELTNEDLAGELGDWTAEKIFDKTGIRSRRVSAAEECASDLGVAAAQRLFETGVCAPGAVDFLIFCTQSPDYFLPATACTMQARLGLRTSCGAVDINQGCSGFVYGLALAKSLVEAGTASCVLLVTADTYSKFLHPRDRSVRTIFGDGAAATLVVHSDGDEELIGPFVLGTDGRGARNLIVPVGGLRRRPSSETAVAREAEGGNWRSDQNLFMNGAEIFNFTLSTVPLAVQQLLEKANGGLHRVDYFVFHQANRFMLERLRDKLKIAPEKFLIDLEDCGNTVSSTIPLALERARRGGKITSGQRVMLVGFGVGYSWAAAMIRVSF
jgi:3-oxoacyl-[acyl-carrier-protein] synthase-3